MSLGLSGGGRCRRSVRGGEVLHSAAFFYADDDVFAFTGPDWMHMSFDTLTSLLYRVGLCTNSRKTVGMLFCP